MLFSLARANTAAKLGRRANEPNDSPTAAYHRAKKNHLINQIRFRKSQDEAVREREKADTAALKAAHAKRDSLRELAQAIMGRLQARSEQRRGLERVEAELERERAEKAAKDQALELVSREARELEAARDRKIERIAAIKAEIERKTLETEEIRAETERLRVETVRLRAEDARKKTEAEHREVAKAAEKQAAKAKAAKDAELAEQAAAAERAAETARAARAARAAEEEAERAATAKAEKERAEREEAEKARADAERAAVEAAAAVARQAAVEQPAAVQQPTVTQHTVTIDVLPAPPTATHWAPLYETDQHRQPSLEVHRRLKTLRRDMREFAKQTPELKALVGDTRREIRKCLGQLIFDNAANKAPTDNLRAVMRKARADTMTPRIDVRDYIVEEWVPPATNPDGSPVVNTADPRLPALFVYALNILSKAAVAQLQTEAASDPEMADPIGLLVARIFGDRDFCWGDRPLTDIVIAKFQVACPILFGVYSTAESGSDRWKKDLGWMLDGPEGRWESVSRYYERMAGLAGGFASIGLRQFSGERFLCPCPNYKYWATFHWILAVPAQRLTGGHNVMLKALVDGFEPRFLELFGSAALMALRVALIEFPNRAPPGTDCVREVRLLASQLERSNYLHLDDEAYDRMVFTPALSCPSPRSIRDQWMEDNVPTASPIHPVDGNASQGFQGTTDFPFPQPPFDTGSGIEDEVMQIDGMGTDMDLGANASTGMTASMDHGSGMAPGMGLGLGLGLGIGMGTGFDTGSAMEVDDTDTRVGSIQLGSSHIGISPLGSIPLGGVPLGGIPLAGPRIGSTQIGGNDPKWTQYR